MEDLDFKEFSKINIDLDFSQDFKIDPDTLDQSVDNYATLLRAYGTMADDKKDEVNEQKKVLKVKDAELKEVYAKLYIKYKNQKVDGKTATDTYVQSKIYLDLEYKDKYNETIKALEKYNKLEHQYNLLETARESIRANKKMISERITLFLSGYNSDIKQADGSKRVHDRLNNRNKYGSED